MAEEFLREIAKDESGNVLWDRPYPFKRLSAVGELLMDNQIQYAVVSSKVEEGIVKTVLRVSGFGTIDFK